MRIADCGLFRSETDAQAAVATLWRALTIGLEMLQSWPRRRPCEVGSASLPLQRRLRSMPLGTLLVGVGNT